MTDLTSKFVTQGELDERRKRRQEEWEKKRGENDPLECPEEVVDNRSLYEKLQEQKDKKEMDYQESISFKNSVKGLQEDEVEFLDYVSQREIALNKARNSEEANIIKEMKKQAVTRIDPEKPDKDERREFKSQIGASQNKKSQQALLAGVVKRKSTDTKGDVKKMKSDNDLSQTALNRNNSSISDSTQSTSDASSSSNSNHGSNISNKTSQVARVIGVLPGLGEYDNDTSDSETSSSDSETEFTLAPPKKVQLSYE